jgi:hypothetical protein
MHCAATCDRRGVIRNHRNCLEGVLLAIARFVRAQRYLLPQERLGILDVGRHIGYLVSILESAAEKILVDRDILFIL